MTDQLISVSLYSYFSACPVYRNMKQVLKGNPACSQYDTTVELVFNTRSVVVYNRNRMESNKASSDKCGGVLHKGSSLLSFISLLLIVALFLRMESINRKTEMNEMQISKVESRVQTELLQTTDHKNDMETLQSKYKRKIGFSSVFNSLVTSWSRRVFISCRSREKFLVSRERSSLSNTWLIEYKQEACSYPEWSDDTETKYSVSLISRKWTAVSHFCLRYLMRCFFNIVRCYLFQVRMYVSMHFVLI